MRSASALHRPLRSVQARARSLRAAGALLWVSVALAAASGSACAPEGTVGKVPAGPFDVELYQTYEISFDRLGTELNDGENPFTRFVEISFTHDEQTLNVDGFYDGDGVWRARFIPLHPGVWTYTWRFGDAAGSGELSVAPWPHPLIGGGAHHGPVLAPRPGSQSLHYADGSPHYWLGGKWLSAKNYGPRSKNGEMNDREEAGSRHDAYLSDAAFEQFLETMTRIGLNGLLMKVGYYPLEDDGVSWDLDWMRRGDAWLGAMNARGIYCQVNLFDPWSRPRGSSFDFTLDPKRQVLDAWSPGQEAEKQNYLRYLVARWGGFANVYWELANRARHPGMNAAAFVYEARTHYVPWLRDYDAYGVAIEMSDVEQARVIPGVDIESPRYDTDLPALPESDKPRIVNELVHNCARSGAEARAYLDATIRTPAHRRCYRSANWVAFTGGAYGSAAASWLDLNRPLNAAVLDVFADQGRLQHFVDALPAPLDQLRADPTFIISAPGHMGTRAQWGSVYVAYFSGPTTEGVINVSLPIGEYSVTWIDPATGDELHTSSVSARGAQNKLATELPLPAFASDAVLTVTRLVTLR